MTDALSFLYVEDDKPSQMVMEIMITRVLGYEDFTVFEDSSDFINRVRGLAKIPDIFFLDIEISPIDGYEMIKALQADPTYQSSKIIAMTANVMLSDVDRLKETGFDGLIGKPLIKDLFPDLVIRILDDESVWFVPE